mmetsp:Transcript_16658/g.46559  ORF Transcript_16658/g.46559 Transcript_16658/m.46559 type:complete len:260 (+) Transcript_16658:2363-3142(+)
MAGGDTGYGRALLYYLRAASLGYEVAQSNAAWMLERGFGVSAVLLPLAQAELKLAGEASGHQSAPLAQTLASEAAARMALRLWIAAAKQGSAAASLQVGDAYFFGRLVPQDRRAAFAMYGAASDKGAAQGSFNLGAMLELGDAVPRNLTMAAEMYSTSLLADPSGWLPVWLALLRLRLKERLLGLGLLDEAEARLPWVLRSSNVARTRGGTPGVLARRVGVAIEALGIKEPLRRAWVACTEGMRRVFRLAMSVAGGIAL